VSHPKVYGMKPHLSDHCLFARNLNRCAAFLSVSAAWTCILRVKCRFLENSWIFG